MNNQASSSPRNTSFQVVFLILLASLAFLQLFVSFKGLSDPVSMDQAQIAREISRGNGFSTKFIRPLSLLKTDAATKGEVRIEQLPDTYQSPLNPYIESLVFSIIGANNPEKWQMNPEVYVHDLDRIVAAISTIFFFCSLLVIYLLISKLFDQTISTIVCLLLLFSNSMWAFAVSGLPQMLMLFLFSLSMYFLHNALKARTQSAPYGFSLILCSIAVALMCTAHWLGIWVVIGLSVYLAFAFRPRGLYAFIALTILLLAGSAFLIRNHLYTGNPFGTAFFSIYEGLQGAEASALRTTELGNVPFQSKELVLRVFAAVIKQADNIYVNLGSIIVAPLFFISLFHPFKKPEIASLRWAIVSMWLFAAIGMTLYGLSGPISCNQLNILFIPLMCAYGLAFVLVLIARLKSGIIDEKQLRIVTYVLIFIISSGTMLLQLPQDIRQGLQSKEKGIPHWPPYYPTALTTKIPELTKPQEVIATDQPWAVAWYSDRPAYWLPKRLDEFNAVTKFLKKKDTSIAGILITPSSHGNKSIMQVSRDYDEFAPLVLEGSIIPLSSQSTVLLLEYIPSLQSLRNQYAGPHNRLPLLGTQIMYYSATEIPESIQKK